MTVQRRTLISLAALAPFASLAQAPTRPVKIIVNFAAGGPLDVMARVLAEDLAKRVGQPVVVENVTGANGNLGVAALTRAEPDGQTLLFTAENALTVSPHIYSSVPYDAMNDVVPVRLVGAFEQALTVPAKSGIRTVEEFVRLAKTRKLSYASAGNGSPGHLAFLAFAGRAGIDATHVPYRGNAPAVNDLLAGHVDAAFVVTGGVLPHLESGKLVALAVSGKERSPDLPKVPTLEQAGYPNFSISYGYVIAVPKGTPAPVRDYWEARIGESLAVPAIAERFRGLNTRMINTGGASAREWLVAASQRWKTTLASGAVKIE